MPTSEVRISNIALTALGANTITSELDGTTESDLILVHYPEARDATLEAREWGFAVQRTQLSNLTEGPEWGYKYAHQVPNDALRIIEVRSVDGVSTSQKNTFNTLDWRREGEHIVSDSKTVNIRYLRRIEDVNLYSPAFVSAFAARLAFHLAIPITQSRTMQADALAVYDALLVQAAATDGLQGRTEIVRASQLVGSRAGMFNTFASGVV